MNGVESTRLVALCALTLLATLPKPTAAQEIGRARPSIIVGAGLSVPVSAAGDFLETGMNVQVGAEHRWERLPAPLRAEAVYHTFDGDNGFPGDARIIGLALSAVPTLREGRLRPWLLGGIGVYEVRVRLRGTTGGAPLTFTDRKAGLNGGAGVEIPVRGITLGVEARYVYIYTSGDATQFVPTTLFIRF